MLDIALGLVLIALMMTGVMFMNRTTTKSVEAKQLVDESILIDDALSVWYWSHNSVYPSDLSTLQDMGFLSPGMDFTNFTYETANSYANYQLTVALPVGNTYTSPGSNE